MSVTLFLSCLDKVKKTGPGSWQACCPSHSDSSPSMSVKETEDGTVLIHCFAGCSIDEILGSVGMPIESLFPPRKTQGKPHRMPFSPSDVLRLVSNEGMIVAASAATMKNRPLTEKEHDRLIEAASKINAALNSAGITTWQN